VPTNPKNDIGRISHHKCAMISAFEVAFFGGNRPEGANNNCHVLNLLTNSWSIVNLQSTIEAENMVRDDHNAVQLEQGSWMCFGGYVNGTRVNELLTFESTGSGINVKMVAGGEDQSGPSCRAGSSLVSHDSNVLMFGGQEDDNKKMNDVWKFDINASCWSKVDIDSDSYCP